MKFINSQYVTEDLTHLTPLEGYHAMKKTGIKICDRGKEALTYKPPGFFISMNGDWERWCTSEEFIDVSSQAICNVYLKPNLTFIRISTVEDANELTRFLMPDMQESHHSFIVNVSDLLNFTSYHIGELRKGKILTARHVWKNALESCDGIYYENSMELHFETFFNTWDCDTLMLFDPRNAILNYTGSY